MLGELVQTTAGKWITCADFKNGSVGFCDQRKQVAESVYTACKTPYLRVARGVAVRLRYGRKSAPVAYTPLTDALATAWRARRPGSSTWVEAEDLHRG